VTIQGLCKYNLKKEGGGIIYIPKEIAYRKDFPLRNNDTCIIIGQEKRLIIEQMDINLYLTAKQEKTTLKHSRKSQTATEKYSQKAGVNASSKF
jgi:arginyl-tRNA synthetase